MRCGSATVQIDAPADVVFDLIHDYAHRLDWDPFLRRAYLLNAATTAQVGVSSCCVARRAVGGLAMETRYLTFKRPTIAAVTMSRGPVFLKSFAASIRHESLGSSRSSVTYRYNFSANPSWLGFVIEPAMAWIFHRETTRRLAALKQYLETTR